MTIIVFDGRTIASDSICVTSEGVVSPVAKVQTHSGLHVCIAGSVTSATVIADRALVKLLKMKEAGLQHLAVKLFQISDADQYACSVYIIDPVSSILWYNSQLDGRMWMIAEPLAPFAIGHSRATDIAHRRLWEGHQAIVDPLKDANEALSAVGIVREAIAVSEQGWVADKFAINPIHTIRI